MISDLDIGRPPTCSSTAWTEDVKLHAAQRADEMLAKGDLDGDRTWRLVLKAIGELAGTEIPPGTSSH